MYSAHVISLCTNVPTYIAAFAVVTLHAHQCLLIYCLYSLVAFQCSLGSVEHHPTACYVIVLGESTEGVSSDTKGHGRDCSQQRISESL